MSENQEPENNPNPWMKSLLVWGGIFMALLLMVSLFGNTGQAAGPAMSYSAGTATASISRWRISDEMPTTLH